MKPAPCGPWTEERKDLLRQNWMTHISVEDILDRINALPAGRPVASVHALHRQARKMQMRRLKPVNTKKNPTPWTEERKDLLRQNWLTHIPVKDLLTRINALPAVLQVASVYALHRQAHKMKMKRPKPAAPKKKPTPWTEERKDLLRRIWVSSISKDDIFAQINALPGWGEIPSISAMGNKAWCMNLKRPRAVSQKQPRVVSQRPPRAVIEKAPQISRRGASPWTKGREDLLQRLWSTKIAKAEILAQINAMPAPKPVASIEAVEKRAVDMCLTRPLRGAALAKAGLDGGAPLPPEDEEEAVELLGRGKDPAWVADWLGATPGAIAAIHRTMRQSGNLPSQPQQGTP